MTKKKAVAKKTVKKIAKKMAPKWATRVPEESEHEISTRRRLGQLESECNRLNKEIVNINQATALLLSAFVGIKGLTELQVRRVMPEQYRVLRELEQPKYSVVREFEKRNADEE